MGEDEEKSLKQRSNYGRIDTHVLTTLQRSFYRLVLPLLQQPLASISPNYPTKLSLTHLHQNG